jgi:O-antigen ligase
VSGLLQNPLLLAAALAGLAGLGLLSLRHPVVLLGVSLFTISLDFMGRINDSIVTYNNLTKVALLVIMTVHLATSRRGLKMPRHVLLALPFVVFVGISTLHSPDLSRAFIHFLRLVVVWSYAVLVANFVTTQRHLKILLVSIALTILVSSGFAHLQTINLLTFGTVDALEAFEPGTFGIRAVSTFWNPNRLALYLLSLSLFLLVALNHHRLSGAWKTVLVLILLSSLGAILLTFSRAAWVSLLVAAILFLRFRETRRIVATVMVAGGVAFLLIMVLTPYGQFILDRLSSFGQLEQDFSTRFRIYLSYIGLSIWADGMNWLWGAGHSAFVPLFHLHLHPLMSHEMAYHTGVYSSHVLWMTLLSETGLIGLLLFLVFIRGLLRETERLLRRARDGTARLVLIGCWVLVVTRLVDWFFNPNLNYNEFWFAVGLIGALGAIVEREAEGRD